MTPRHFRSKQPTKQARITAVHSIAVTRDKPLDDAAKVSLSRSYGLNVSEIESIFAEEARRRAA